MRLQNVFVLIAATLLVGACALPTTSTDEGAELPTLTFTERPQGDRLLEAEETVDNNKRNLRKRQTEDGEAEERSMWDMLVKKVKLQYWFQKAKKPEWVRAKLGIPATGPNVESHVYYKLFQNYIKNYNGYKYHRFSGN